MMKHVGKVGTKPCVVLFREVPNDTEFCLVVETQSLAPPLHDALMSVIQSPEAQESNEVSEVLHRRQFPDGTNMLSSLHYNKKISKVSTSLVTLTPTPSTSIALTDVIAELKKIKNKSNPPSKTEMDPSVYDRPLVETDPDLAATEQTAYVAEQNAAEEGDTDGIARNILMQAQLMEEDAKRLLADAEAKRAEAYALDPNLEPKKGPGRPRKTDV